MAQPVLRDSRTKRPDEIVSQTFTFVDVLVAGSTLTSTVVVTPQTGLTVIGTSVATPLVTVQFSGGTAGNDYSLKCKAIASNGDDPELEVVILVRDEN